MEPSVRPNALNKESALQIRTVFTEKTLLESLGKKFEAQRRISGYIIREVILSHGRGFELLFCMPSDSPDLAKKLAKDCGDHIKRHWHTPATFIEPAISPVTINPEFAKYLGLEPGSSSIKKRCLSVASLAGLTLVALCGLRKSGNEASL